MLNGKKREYGISAAPTTSGANVRTIGIKRARITVFTPYFSKNCMCFFDAARFEYPRRFAVKKRLAHHPPGPVTRAVADHRAEKKREHHERDIQLSGRRKKA